MYSEIGTQIAITCQGRTRERYFSTQGTVNISGLPRRGAAGPGGGSGGPGVPGGRAPPAVPAAERKRMRTGLLRRPEPGEKAASFGDFLAGHRLRVDARWYAPAGRWVTPPAMPIRFDARFYMVDLPPGEVAEIWPGELADGEWIDPAAALRRWEAGSALLHPPAWHTLKALAWATGHPRDALPLLTAPEKAPRNLPIPEPPRE